MNWYLLWALPLPDADGQLAGETCEGLFVIAPLPPDPDNPLSEVDLIRHGEGIDFYDGAILGAVVRAESPDMAILRGEQLTDEFLMAC